MSTTLDEHLFEPENENKKIQKWYSILLVILLIGYVISTGFSWYQVETIMVSALIMSIIGIIFSIIAYKMYKRFSVFFGLIPLIISILLISIISFYDFSPGDCKFIVPLFLSVLTGIIIIIGLNILYKKNLR